MQNLDLGHLDDHFWVILGFNTSNQHRLSPIFRLLRLLHLSAVVELRQQALRPNQKRVGHYQLVSQHQLFLNIKVNIILCIGQLNNIIYINI